MTPEQRDEAKELFAEAIELEGDAQQTFAAEVRQTHGAEVVELFDQLLADYLAAEEAGFLDSPAMPSPDATVDNNATVDEELANPNATVEFISGESLSVPRPTGERPGALLADDYEIQDEIGRGGMGTVYRAYQLSLRRHVAVKIIPTHLIRSPEESARFYIEAEAAAGLDHPGIVQVQDVGERNGVHYYTMALVTGGSLSDFVGREKRLTRRRAAEVMEQVSRAVQYAHDRAVIHRDIKPANILLDNEGHPRLTDFGLAKFVNTDDHLTMTGQVMGTPSYMAPEQAEGKSSAISTRTDVYSLGATLYALLAGKAPFSGETLFSTLQQVQKSAPAALPDSVPIDLRVICEKCLAKNPDERYDSAGDLADDLQRYLDGFPISARRVGPLQRLIGWSRREPLVASLVGGIAASLLIGAIVSLVFGLEARHQASEARRQEAIALQNLADKTAEAKKLEKAIEETLIYASEELLIEAPGMEETRRTLLENARRYYDVQLASGELSAGKVADVTARLGKIDALLGDRSTAQQQYDRAIELYQQQLHETPATADAAAHWRLTRELAQLHREYANLGQLIWIDGRETNDEQGAEQGFAMFVDHAQACVDLRQQAADALPADYELKRKLANAQMNLGIAKAERYAYSSDEADLDAAEQLCNAAQELRSEIADKHPEPSKVTIDQALGLESLATVLLQRATGLQAEEVAAMLEKVLEYRLDCFKRLAALPLEAQNHRTDRLLATALQNVGSTYELLGHEEEAIKYFNGMRHTLERLLLRNPGVTKNRIDLARAEFNLSQKLLTTNKTNNSEVIFRSCQETLANGPIVRYDDAKPVQLLVEFTEHVAKQLVGGQLPQEAFDRITYAKKLLEALPPKSRQQPYVQQAIDQLNQVETDLKQSIDDKPV